MPNPHPDSPREPHLRSAADRSILFQSFGSLDLRLWASRARPRKAGLGKRVKFDAPRNNSVKETMWRMASPGGPPLVQKMFECDDHYRIRWIVGRVLVGDGLGPIDDPIADPDVERVDDDSGIRIRIFPINHVGPFRKVVLSASPIGCPSTYGPKAQRSRRKRSRLQDGPPRNSPLRPPHSFPPVLV